MFRKIHSHDYNNRLQVFTFIARISTDHRYLTCLYLHLQLYYLIEYPRFIAKYLQIK